MAEEERAVGEHEADEDRLARARNRQGELAPQLRTTTSACGPSSAAPNVERSASCGAIAAQIIVEVRAPDASMIQRMLPTIQLISSP